MSEVDLSGFDANEQPEQEEFKAMPEGDYVVLAVDSEMKANREGAGQHLHFTFEVIDGQYKGRKLFDRLNLINDNQAAVDNAKRALGAICRAVGVPKPRNNLELHNKPLVAVVKVELDKKDGKTERNVIKKYKPVSDQSANVGFAGTPAATPAANTPAAATPAASSAPPWAKK